MLTERFFYCCNQRHIDRFEGSAPLAEVAIPRATDVLTLDRFLIGAARLGHPADSAEVVTSLPKPFDASELTAQPPAGRG